MEKDASQLQNVSPMFVRGIHADREMCKMIMNVNMTSNVHPKLAWGVLFVILNTDDLHRNDVKKIANDNKNIQRIASATL